MIEVKSLNRSPVHQLMELVGQYLVYRSALDYLDIETLLYVAAPQEAYRDITQNVLGRRIIEQYSIPFVIYDWIQEEILEWIPPL